MSPCRIEAGAETSDLEKAGGGTGNGHGEEADASGKPGPRDVKNKPDDGQEDTDHGAELAKRFLRMTSYGTHGRIFTYVIMLDGEWRFTVRRVRPCTPSS